MDKDIKRMLLEICTKGISKEVKKMVTESTTGLMEVIIGESLKMVRSRVKVSG